MRYCNTSEEIKRLAASGGVFAQSLASAREKDAFWRSTFQDDKTRLCGWFHNFVCPKCAKTFRQDYTFKPGRVFVCENCGATASSQKLDEAWVFGYRYNASNALTSSALVYLVDGVEKSLDYIVRFIDFYADAYADFPVHGNWAGMGKIMGQSLDEAVWACAVIRALNVVGKDAIPAEKREKWREKLFMPLADLIGRQATIIHNIPLWLQAARGVIALYYGDKALFDDAVESEFGVRNQAKKGYTKDGLWYELSLGYHFYATEALCEFVADYACVNPDDELVGYLRRAYQTPGQLCTDGWTLPSINDMGYPAKIISRSRPGIRACRVAYSDEVAFQVAEELRREPENLLGAETLLFMPPDAAVDARGFAKPDKKLFPDTCLAIMNKPFSVILKTGSLTKSHMHADALSVILSPFSDDLGTPGYGHPMCSAYYRQTLSHNTVLMDGMSQPFRPQKQSVVDLPDGMEGRVEDYYDGVAAARSVTASGSELVDVFTVKAQTDHQFDWVFHSAGEADLPSNGAASELPGEDPAYQYLTDVMEYAAPEGFEARFTLNGRTLTVRLPRGTTENARVFTAKIPSNPANISLTAIIVRARAASVRFEARYKEE